MNFTLLNKKLNRKLTHPRIGLWFSNDLEEAKSMLSACREYLDASGFEDMKSDFVIINADTEEEVEC